MARKPAPKPVAQKAKKPASAGTNKIVVLMILAALIPFSLPTVVVVFFTMLPTLAAWASEKGQHKYAWLCVGGLNFAGVVPFLFTLWFGVHTLDESFNMLSEGDILLWAYGCSALGWMVYMSMPPLVSSWLRFTTEHRVSALQSAQKKLIEEWGEDVGRKPGT